MAQHETTAGGRDTVIVLSRKAQMWRRATYALAAACAMLAVGLGALVSAWLPGSPDTLVAVIERQTTNPAADEPETATGPVFLATMQMGSRTMEVRQVAGRRPPAGRHYAIWLLGAAGTGAVQLGTIDRLARSATLAMPSQATGAEPSRTIAVSVESETTISAPTGAYISIGKLEGAAR